MCLLSIVYLLYRFESFNSSVRLQNIYENKQAPSRDIANHFATVEYLRYICGGGLFKGDERLDIRYLYPFIQLQLYTDAVTVLKTFTIHMKCKVF